MKLIKDTNNFFLLFFKDSNLENDFAGANCLKQTIYSKLLDSLPV